MARTGLSVASTIGGRKVRSEAGADSERPTLALRDAFDESTIRARTLCAASIQSAATKIEHQSSRFIMILLVALFTALGAGIIIVVWLTQATSSSKSWCGPPRSGRARRSATEPSTDGHRVAGGQTVQCGS